MARLKKSKRSKGLLSPAERRKLREMCDRAVSGHGLRTPAVVLAEMATLSAEDLKLDMYGEGGTVTTLEDEVRGLLGKPAAVFTAEVAQAVRALLPA